MQASVGICSSIAQSRGIFQSFGKNSLRVGGKYDKLVTAVGSADWCNLRQIAVCCCDPHSGLQRRRKCACVWIGATLECLIDGLLGLEAGPAAALGLMDLFCCATNVPPASVMLCIEVLVSGYMYLFVMYGHCGLYARRILEYSKTEKITVSEEIE